MYSPETPQWKEASSRLEGRTSWIFSSCGRCSRLMTATSGTRSGGLRKGQSPCELLGGLSGVLLPSMPVPKTLCGVGAGTCRFLSRPDMYLGVFLDSPQGSQSSSRVGACTCAFLPSCSSSVALPFARIKESVDFPGGFPTRLSPEAFPQGCPTCYRGVSRSSA